MMNKRDIINIVAKTPVYWYSGSGNDLVSLLLMAPGAHRFGHSFRDLSQISPTQKNGQMVLWLTDTSSKEPQDLFNAPQFYQELWCRLGAKLDLISIEEVSIFGEQDFSKHFLVKVNVIRENSTDEYSFIYSRSDAYHFLEKLIIPKNIDISWVAYIRLSFGILEKLPKKLSSSHRDLHGYPPYMPEVFIADGYWYNENKNDLRMYKRLGSHHSSWGDPSEERIRSGGVHNWGYGRDGSGTAALWVRPDKYDHYYKFIDN